MLGHVVVQFEHVLPLYTHVGFSWHAVWLLEYVLHAVEDPVKHNEMIAKKSIEQTESEALAAEVVVRAARRVEVADELLRVVTARRHKRCTDKSKRAIQATRNELELRQM